MYMYLIVKKNIDNDKLCWWLLRTTTLNNGIIGTLEEGKKVEEVGNGY